MFFYVHGTQSLYEVSARCLSNIVLASTYCFHDFRFKENLNASKPSDQSKGLGGNIGCRDKNLYMVLKGFPNVVTWSRINSII